MMEVGIQALSLYHIFQYLLNEYFLHGCINQKLHLPKPIENSFHRIILSERRAEKKYFLSKSTLNIYATMDNVRRKKETTFFQLQSEIPKLFKNVSFPFEHIQCPNSVFFYFSS